MSVRKTYMWLSPLVLFLGACATGFQATHDRDPGHDFSGYQTFAWISANPMTAGATNRINNPMLEPRIMASVDRALRAKGYEKQFQAENADFVLSFTVGSRDQIKIDSYPTMSGGYASYPRRWGGAYYGYGTQTSVRQYTEGMLAIDVFDVKERKPVWHGYASKRISAADRRDADTTINAAVDAILEGFPSP
ncbi:MAG: DUF4136 domain-containing protein [Woeseiaceae bacterium]